MKVPGSLSFVIFCEIRLIFFDCVSQLVLFETCFDSCSRIDERADRCIMVDALDEDSDVFAHVGGYIPWSFK